MIQKILLTGAGGKLGRRLRQPLARLCDALVSTDLVALSPVAGNESVVSADLADASAVERLVAGAHAIVHFAGYPREADWASLIPANIVATTHLWEAALAHGVRRIVYASTNHVVGFHPVGRHIGVNDEIKCDSRYGVSKAFAETLARFYYEKYGIESLGLRIGRCEEAPTDERMLSTWLHPDDLVQLVGLGLHHPVRADIAYGISDNARAWCSNPPAEELPYRPAHRADSYPLPASQPAAPSRWLFQGGPFAQADYRGETTRAADFYRNTSCGPSKP